MDDVLEALKDGLDKLLESNQDKFGKLLDDNRDCQDNVELKPPDPKKMGINHAVALTDKYFELEKKLEILKFWLECEKTKIEKQQKFIEDCCKGFMQNYMEQCGSKQLILPNGHKFGLRKSQDGIDIEEEEKAIQWCEENLKEACKTEVHLLKKPIIAYIKSTGSIPVGVKFITAESKGLSFSIG